MKSLRSRRLHRRLAAAVELLEPRRLLTSVFTVNTTTDTVDANPSLTSLREAVNSANANPDADVINFDPSLAGQTVLLSGIGNGTVGRSALLISTPIIIQGLTGNAGITISRNLSTPDL